MAPYLRIKLAGLAIALLAPSVGDAASVGGAIIVTSDYVLRGVSQTDSQPALQGEAHLNLGNGWSTGVWASQVQIAPPRHTAEVDAFVQWRGALNDDFDFGATATHYGYPGDPRRISYDYEELAGSLAWRDQLYLTASWIPRVNFFDRYYGPALDRQVYILEAAAHRSLRPHLDLAGGLGVFYTPGLDYASYGYGNATLAWHYGHWRADLALIWVQNESHRDYVPGPKGGPLTATLAWSY